MTKHINDCHFSPDRKYRYLLTHRWDELMEPRPIAWIGLNPSTADENDLDPTLRRIKGFSTLLGYNQFHMLNLFAFRATNPKVMMIEEDPVGPKNDYWIEQICGRADCIVACWGTSGQFLERENRVKKILLGLPIYCLKKNGDGSPGHPLYLSKGSGLQRYP